MRRLLYDPPAAERYPLGGFSHVVTMPSPSPGSVRIFEQSPDSWENAMLQSGFDDWRSYAHCYRTAAEALATEYPEQGEFPDPMFLPVLYLYRHYVEASLKGILTHAKVAYELSYEVPMKHQLDELWLLVQTHVGAKRAGVEPAWFDRASELIAELHQVDPDSMSFRYPTDKKGARLLTPGFRVSTKRVTLAMADLATVLEGMAGYLEAITEFDTFESSDGTA